MTRTTKNTIKYYTNNRCLWLIYAWTICLLALVGSNNPMLNAMVLIIAFIVIVTCVGFVMDRADNGGANANERLFISKFNKLNS